ncbi:MAG: hypothetical protein EON58_19630, partial [Alphaproteobacteria bacterium]
MIDEAEKAADGMGWLDFFASMTGSLAWPIAALGIALLFRSQIRTLLSRLNEIALGDAKATFAKDLDRAEKQAAALPATEDVEEVDAHEEVGSGQAEEQADQVDSSVPSDRSRPTSTGTNDASDDPPEDADHNQLALAYRTSLMKRYRAAGVESGRFALLLEISPNAAILDTYRAFERILFRAARRALPSIPEQAHSAASIRKALVANNLIDSSVELLIAQLQDMRNKAAHGADATVPDAIRFRDLANRASAV